MSAINDELEALRNKNRELLDELKKARAKNAEIEKSVEAVGALEAEIKELKLNKPVRELLSEVLIPPNKFAIAEVMDDYDFQLDDSGQIQIRDKHGKPIRDGENEVEFDVECITQLLGAEEKYAEYVRTIARNEPLNLRKTLETPKPQETHFGIR